MTPRQKEFARLYASCGKVNESCVGAGYTETYAKAKGHLLLNNPDVVSEIKRIRGRIEQKADKSSTDVVNEFSKIAFTDRVAFLKPDPLREGEFIYKAPDELTPEQRSVVEKVTWNNCEIVIIVGKGKDKDIQSHWRQEYNYILSDKAKALENMGRHFGIFDDKLRLGVSSTNPFSNATPAQMEKLKESWIKTMTDPKLLEGEFKVVNSGK